MTVFFSHAAPSLDKFPAVEVCKIPGELICGPGHIIINLGREGVILKVTNTGDRPVQVTKSCDHILIGTGFFLFQGVPKKKKRSIK